MHLTLDQLAQAMDFMADVQGWTKGKTTACPQVEDDGQLNLLVAVHPTESRDILVLEDFLEGMLVNAEYVFTFRCCTDDEGDFFLVSRLVPVATQEIAA